jgi:predicted nucleotidyltransferase/uncharacterized protein with HEPN domain
LAKTSGLAQATFISDEMRYLPVIVLLVRMADSVGRLSHHFREANAQVPWSEIAAVKSRVQPDPFSDDPAAAWDIVAGPLQAWHAEMDALVPAGFGEPADAEPGGPHGESHGSPRTGTRPRVRISGDRLADLCRRHGVRRLSLFGSALRDDFGPASDVDLLVEFEPGADPSWRLASVEREFSEAFDGHPVEMVEPDCLDKYIRHRVLEEAEEIYAA